MLVAAILSAILVLAVAGLAFGWLRARGRALATLAIGTATRDDEFSTLSEAERCDLVFAVAALDDQASREILERALDDPSETVALAAACTLNRLGRGSTVESYLASRPGERARRIRETVELLV
jgi:HEAT repeat protein